MANRILLVDDECHILHADDFKFRPPHSSVETARRNRCAGPVATASEFSPAVETDADASR